MKNLVRVLKAVSLLTIVALCMVVLVDVIKNGSNLL